MLIQGSLDVDGLLAAAGGLGLVELGQEPEKHRDYDIQSVDVFDISLALASVDGSSLLIATGSPSVGATGPEQIRTALDSFDGLVAALLDDPGTSRMVRKSPPGMMAGVLGNCANLTVLFHNRTLQGCTGAAIGAALGGAFAGLAGMIEVSAVQGSANGSLAAGYGYAGILVAFLARHNGLAIIPVAILIGGMEDSSGLVQRRMDLPDATVLVQVFNF